MVTNLGNLGGLKLVPEVALVGFELSPGFYHPCGSCQYHGGLPLHSPLTGSHYPPRTPNQEHTCPGAHLELPSLQKRTHGHVLRPPTWPQYSDKY